MERQKMTLNKWVKQEAKRVMNDILRDAAKFYDDQESFMQDVMQDIIEGAYAEWIAPVAEYRLYNGELKLPTKGKVYQAFQEEYDELRYEYRTIRKHIPKTDEDIRKEAWSYTLYNLLHEEVAKLAEKELAKLQKKAI